MSNPISIPRTADLQIDEDLNLFGTQPYELSTINGETFITTDFQCLGSRDTVSLSWLWQLSVISHKTDLSWALLRTITFVDTNGARFTPFCGAEPTFPTNRHPEAIPGFRYFPRMLRYAVDENGNVYDTHRKIIVKVDGLKSVDYDYLPMYMGVNPTGRTVMYLHIAVGWTWLERRDVTKYRIINHLDGDKHNPKVSNLEFTTDAGNCEHAIVSGLRNDNNTCHCIDIETGELSIHASQARLSEFVGASSESLSRWLLGSRLTPWRGKYNVRREFEEWSNFKATTTTVIRVECMNTLTGECTKPMTVSQAKVHTGIGDSTIRTILLRKSITAFKGWSFRAPTTDPWPANIERNRVDARTINARSPDGKIVKAKSIREMQTKCGIDRKFISAAVRLKKFHKGWKFWID